MKDLFLPPWYSHVFDNVEQLGYPDYWDLWDRQQVSITKGTE